MGKGTATHTKRKMIVFDLDGTLTASKAPLDQEMGSLLCALLAQKRVAVMSGGSLSQIKKQFLDRLPCRGDTLERLSLLPTSGASMYVFKHGKIREVYVKSLSAPERAKVMSSFERALEDIGYTHPVKTYGPVFEDRETQITFSALGQRAPLAEKERWNRDHDIRAVLRRTLGRHLPSFEVRLGGKTSVDVTKKGVDKAYGMRQVLRHFGFKKNDAVYVGDALQRGGNDAAVKRAGVAAVSVRDHEETKLFIRSLLGHV